MSELSPERVLEALRPIVDPDFQKSIVELGFVKNLRIEGGRVEYPVHEVTVAGNLKDMYRGIVDIGTDVDMRGGVRTGSILIGEMTIAGD